MKHPDIDLAAIVITFDPELGIVMDLGSVSPELASHWLSFAQDEVEQMIDAIYNPCFDDEETE